MIITLYCVYIISLRGSLLEPFQEQYITPFLISNAEYYIKNN